MSEDNAAQPSEERVENAEDQKDPTWAGVCHLSATLGLIWWIPGIAAWIPIGHLIAPLAVWYIKRGDSPLNDAAGREAINFQLWMTLYGAIVTIVSTALLGVNLVLALAVLDAGIAVHATIWTCTKERTYRYPLVPFRLLGRGADA